MLKAATCFPRTLVTIALAVVVTSVPRLSVKVPLFGFGAMVRPYARVVFMSSTSTKQLRTVNANDARAVPQTFEVE